MTPIVYAMTEMIDPSVCNDKYKMYISKLFRQVKVQRLEGCSFIALRACLLTQQRPAEPLS